MTSASDPDPAAGLMALSGGSVDAVERLVEAILRRGDSVHTRRAYGGDLRAFARWLGDERLSWDAVTGDDLDRYRASLATRCARASTNRRLTVVRSLYSEATRRGLLSVDPADRLRGVRGRDERDGGALTRGEAKELLATTERDLKRSSKQLIAHRDLAIIALLVRTGLRRFELAFLQVGDLGQQLGHNVLTIRAGKGNVQRTVKLPPEVRRAIDAWLGAASEAGLDLHDDDPMFVEVRKGGRVASRKALSDRAIHRIVTRRLMAAGLQPLGPHGLRATFVTLALEGGAPLHLVQRAAGHADPRTTERYWRRKDNLDDNAVDYVRL